MNLSPFHFFRDQEAESQSRPSRLDRNGESPFDGSESSGHAKREDRPGQEEPKHALETVTLTSPDEDHFEAAGSRNEQSLAALLGNGRSMKQPDTAHEGQRAGEREPEDTSFTGHERSRWPDSSMQDLGGLDSILWDEVSTDGELPDEKPAPLNEFLALLEITDGRTDESSPVVADSPAEDEPSAESVSELVSPEDRLPVELPVSAAFWPQAPAAEAEKSEDLQADAREESKAAGQLGPPAKDESRCQAAANNTDEAAEEPRIMFSNGTGGATESERPEPTSASASQEDKGPLWVFEAENESPDQTEPERTVSVSSEKAFDGPNTTPADSHLRVEAFEKAQPLKDLLEEFVGRSKALTALFVSRQGAPIAAAGFVHSLDIEGIAALSAGMFAATKELARLAGEEEFSLLLQQGRQRHLHLSLIARDVLMVVLFEDHQRAGVIRHEARKAGDSARGLLAEEQSAVSQLGQKIESGEFQEFALNLLDRFFE